MADTFPIPTTLFLLDNLDTYFDGLNSFRMLLCDASGWPSDTLDLTLEQAIASEVAEANGYVRASVAPSSAAAENATKTRVDRALPTATFTASASQYSYSGYVLLPNAASAANKAATADNTTNRLTVTAHGITNGDRLMLTTDSGGSLPTGLSATTRYYGKSIDTDTLELYTDAGLTILATFTSDGSSLRLRYANGKAPWAKKLSSTRTIDSAGSDHEITVTLAFGSTSGNFSAV